MKLFATALLLATASSAQAALPPYWDRVEQMKVVLASPALEQALGGLLIESIEKASDNNLAFQVHAGGCATELTLKVIPSDRIGPVQYEVESVGALNCL